MESLANLSEAQRLAFEKLEALIGNEQMDNILSQGPEVLSARLNAFMDFEPTLIGQVHDHLAASMPIRYVRVRSSSELALPSLNSVVEPESGL